MKMNVPERSTFAIVRKRSHIFTNIRNRLQTITIVQKCPKTFAIIRNRSLNIFILNFSFNLLLLEKSQIISSKYNN